jgi:hypothetical protein
MAPICGLSPVPSDPSLAGPQAAPIPPSPSTRYRRALSHPRPPFRRRPCLAAPAQRRAVARALGPLRRIPKGVNVQAAWAASPAASPVAPIDKAASPVTGSRYARQAAEPGAGHHYLAPVQPPCLAGLTTDGEATPRRAPTVGIYAGLAPFPPEWAIDPAPWSGLLHRAPPRAAERPDIPVEAGLTGPPDIA